MLYSATLLYCSSLFYSALLVLYYRLYCTVLYSAALFYCSTLLCSALLPLYYRLYCTVLYCTLLLYSTLLLFSTLLYSALLLLYNRRLREVKEQKEEQKCSPFWHNGPLIYLPLVNNLAGRGLLCCQCTVNRSVCGCVSIVRTCVYVESKQFLQVESLLNIVRNGACTTITRGKPCHCNHNHIALYNKTGCGILPRVCMPVVAGTVSSGDSMSCDRPGCSEDDQIQFGRKYSEHKVFSLLL